MRVGQSVCEFVCLREGEKERERERSGYPCLFPCFFPTNRLVLLHREADGGGRCMDLNGCIPARGLKLLFGRSCNFMTHHFYFNL